MTQFMPYTLSLLREAGESTRRWVGKREMLMLPGEREEGGEAGK